MSRRVTLWHNESPGGRVQVDVRWPRSLWVEGPGPDGVPRDFATNSEILRMYRRKGIGVPRIPWAFWPSFVFLVVTLFGGVGVAAWLLWHDHLGWATLTIIAVIVASKTLPAGLVWLTTRRINRS